MNQETKQLTAQQLALYLGCEAQVCIENDKTAIARINQINESFAYGNLHDRRLSMRQTWHLWEVKPLLRPLSDISEEEAKHIYHNLKDYESECSVQEYIDYKKQKDPDYEWSYVKRLDYDDEFYCPMIVHHLGDPMVWAYLLSRGFDLFNWIDQGLAIDKTRVNDGSGILSTKEKDTADSVLKRPK